MKQHPPRSRFLSVAECGTSSVHSSFRDITEQCNRERLLSEATMLGNAAGLSGVAELGCAGSTGANAGGNRWSRNSDASSMTGLIIVAPGVQNQGKRQTL